MSYLDEIDGGVSQRTRRKRIKGIELVKNKFHSINNKAIKSLTELSQDLFDKGIGIPKAKLEVLEALIDELSKLHDQLAQTLHIEEMQEESASFIKTKEDYLSLLEHLHKKMSTPPANADKQDKRSSRKSKASSKGSKSAHFCGAEAAARAAALRMELEFLEEETAQKIELEKAKSKLSRLRLAKEIDMTEAGIRAAEEYDEDGGSHHSSVSSEVKLKRVQAYVESQTLDPDAKEYVPASAKTHIEPSEHLPVHTEPPHTPKKLELESCNLEELLMRLSEQATLNRLPPPEPTIFYGDPLKFPEWESSFETLIERRGIPASEKLHYLKRYLGGEAKEAVEGYFFLTSTEAYNTAKDVLKKRYGDNFIVAGAFRRKLETWPKIQARDRTGLRKFSDFLNQLGTAMLSITSLQILNDDRENSRVLTKLPEWLVNRWARVVAKYKTRTSTYPPFSEFAKFIREEADIACDPVTSLESIRDSHSDGSRNIRSRTRTVGASTLLTSGEEEKQKTRTPQKKKTGCLRCQGEHYLDNCEMFLAMSLDERKQFIREKGLCFGCLIPGHRSAECRKRKTCTVCSKRHPTALHGDVRKQVAETADTTQPTKEVTSHFAESGTCSSSMILPVWLSHCDSSAEVLTYALLDTQSDATFLLEETKEKLGIVGSEVTLSLSTMTGINQQMVSQKILGLRVRGYQSSEKIPLPATYTRDMMPANRSHIPTPEMASKWPQFTVLQNQLTPLQDCEVGLLIGYNCPRALAPREVITTSNNGPYGQRTDLGWSIIGTFTDDAATHVDGPRYQVVHRTTVKEVFRPATICRILERDFDENGSGQGPSREDKRFLKTMEDGIQQHEDGHYQMPLPLRRSDLNLPNSQPMARQRLQQLQTRLAKNAKLREDYTKFMDNVLEKDFAEKIPKTEWQGIDGRTWYIPHHGVYHPHKPEKIRVVFDASATYKGVSLNQQLLQGPDLTNNLVGVLCRLRKEPIVITCDIEQMFYQFRVSKEHQDFLRFLWWEDGDITKEPSHYKMKVHLFGATSSPGCANYALKHIAEKASSAHPKGAAFIRRNFYVDDGITSVGSQEEAIQLIHETKEICSEAGLRLHKFVSNSKEVLKDIPEQDRALGIKDINLDRDNTMHIEKTLGVDWCIESDTFKFRVMLRDKPCTRRGVLSTICSLYDPLGLVAPIILKGKMILQQICRVGNDWDSPLPEDIRSSWERWRSELVLLQDLDIKRCYKPSNFGHIKTVELHHFSDASTHGYGQCSYLRLINEEGNIHCSLVMGKSRVAPLKAVTIPRQELTAAVVSTKVSKILQDELEYTGVKETFWTDSKVILGYINNEARRFHVFVSNRVQQIRDHSNPHQWKYVSTSENPADEGSRGLTAQEFSSSMWLQGPDFLWKDIQPQAELYPLSTEDPEVKITMTTSTRIEKTQSFDELVNFSSWTRARRAIATCLRYMDALKNTVRRPVKQYHPCTVEDVQRGENTILKLVQREAFSKELSILRNRTTEMNTTSKGSPLHKLDPFCDSKGVLRVGGRLKMGDMAWEVKHPVILPKNHHISTIVIRHYHERIGHAGRGMTINEVRSNGFWILGCSSLVRSIISKCITCKRNYGAAQEQKMGNLPPERFEHGPPFTYVGADYFGPWLIKEGRKEMKRYGVLFTCMASRAIHIETANSLTTDAFINALRRFIAIRGPIRELRSDRGTNFVGAAAELKAAAKEIENVQVRKFLAENNCDFKTNSPSASHTGGVWERQIRSVRRVLQSLMQKMGSQLDDESLRTLMCEVAAIINGRPLSVDNITDPQSPCPLTPNAILTMKSNIVLPPPGEFQREDTYSRKRWRRVQHIANEFWKRWQNEFLQTLSVRQKWTRPRRNIQVDDIVLIKDETECRNLWRLGRITEAYPGKDGLVRSVKLTVADRMLDGQGRRTHPAVVLQRPIQKLHLLLSKEDQATPPRSQ